MTTSSRQTRLAELLEQRILILDGACGTRLRNTLQESGGATADGIPAVETLVLKRPDMVLALHEEYLRAGADIIETDSFMAATPAVVEALGDSSVLELNRCAANLARQAADRWSKEDHSKSRFVAGSVGPEGRGDHLKQQVNGLCQGGTDVLLLESIYSKQGLEAVLTTVDEALGETGTAIPVWVSFTLRTPSDKATVLDLARQTLRHPIKSAVTAVGLNCCLGPDSIAQVLPELARIADIPLLACPSAGLPDASGAYPVAPDSFSASLASMARQGLLNIAGSCCGTTPEYTAELVARLRDIPPRTVIRAGNSH
jgi:5-methyltetrahydrofolate--homocysteine methyltransferase